jgi:hypothetical protein
MVRREARLFGSLVDLRCRLGGWKFEMGRSERAVDDTLFGDRVGMRWFGCKRRTIRIVSGLFYKEEIENWLGAST